ncbi:hypothetical protein HNQ59_002891 [Chitinivorax tropicus]|uniref:Uncharacterized protein n=1 Tax=Chitinivorax tropicus TaxID=714531 RepID=A0A840MR74_9PROT|nr:hypothetical protein [Chitinivorax tropicus]MBB5019589.1 hypothetical protein [Chitinivorax tropicus]
MQVPITTAGNLSLRAMALVLNRDPACLAADLLGAALADVQASCSADIQKQIRAAMHTIEQASLPENQPGTQFVAGGT